MPIFSREKDHREKGKHSHAQLCPLPIPAIQEAEAGRLQIQGLPGRPGDFKSSLENSMSQKQYGSFEAMK